MSKKFLKFVFIYLATITFAISEELIIFNFTEEEYKSLKVKKIKNETTYIVGSNENGNYLKAQAKGTASGLGKEIKIDTN